jgi:hypothetical protein
MEYADELDTLGNVLYGNHLDQVDRMLQVTEFYRSHPENLISNTFLAAQPSLPQRFYDIVIAFKNIRTPLHQSIYLPDHSMHLLTSLLRDANSILVAD